MVEQIISFGNTLQEVDRCDFVEVIFARTRNEAGDYRALLEGHGIASRIETGLHTPSQYGVAVLIPKDRLVEASEILTIQAQEPDDDDFYYEDEDDEDDYEDDDVDLDDEDEDDFDDEEYLYEESADT
ncbi:MAG: hypothetical protein MI923_23820 [Phycisphaerales bacterium]|nr:hypothetical protein [Phycisphaerales bacterium]